MLAYQVLAVVGVVEDADVLQKRAIPVNAVGSGCILELCKLLDFFITTYSAWE